MKRAVSEDYRKFRLKQTIGLIKYCVTIAILLALIVWAPNQAAQFTGYLGSFILGGTKLKSVIGL
jgi:hypothetical protein